MPVNCDKCSSVRGSSCHCAACHQTFASIKLFDNHQSVNYKRNPPVKCKNPEKMGLVLDAWGTWRTRENLVATANRVAAMNTSKFQKRQDDESE